MIIGHTGHDNNNEHKGRGESSGSYKWLDDEGWILTERGE
jgi:hypothetical protein